jgi:hypothetical protein
MKANYLEVLTKKLNTNEILFKDEVGEITGSIHVENEKIFFNASSNGMEYILNEPQEPQGIGASGVNHGEYLYWDTNKDPPNWSVGGNQVNIGTNAGKTGQGAFAIAIGAYAGFTGETSNNIVINATGQELSAQKSNALYIAPIQYEPQTGVTGDFITSVSSSQNTNVMSYNSTTKEVTYRSLGLYNDDTSNLPVTGTEPSQRIVATNSIIPNINGFKGTTGVPGVGLSLGNESAYWNAIYAREVYTTNNTIYITDPITSERMAIKYDPANLSSTVSNSNITVQNVTTSKVIPGQIDSSLLPFTGLSFMGVLNGDNYVSTIGDSFIHQTLKLMHTLDNTIITQIPEYTEPTTYRTNDIFQRISGSYYTVSGVNNPQGITISIPELVADTDLPGFDKFIIGEITTTFSIYQEKEITIKDNDMLIISCGLISNPNDMTKISLLVQWNRIEFRVPINGISTFNIVDSSITNVKLADYSVTNVKIADNSIDSIKLMNNSVTERNIDNYSVTNIKLADNSVSNRTILDESITESKLSNTSVGTNKIKPNVITFDKLSTNVQDLLINKENAPALSQALYNALNESIVNSNILITSLNQEIIALRETNQRWEQKFAAIDDYIEKMSMTYVIMNQETEEEYVYNKNI